MSSKLLCGGNSAGLEVSTIKLDAIVVCAVVCWVGFRPSTFAHPLSLWVVLGCVGCVGFLCSLDRERMEEGMNINGNGNANGNANGNGNANYQQYFERMKSFMISYLSNRKLEEEVEHYKAGIHGEIPDKTKIDMLSDALMLVAEFAVRKGFFVFDDIRTDISESDLPEIAGDELGLDLEELNDEVLKTIMDRYYSLHNDPLNPLDEPLNNEMVRQGHNVGMAGGRYTTRRRHNKKKTRKTRSRKTRKSRSRKSRH